MLSIFRQTRTRVHSPADQRREREHGLASSARAMAAIQLGAQLILWIFFFGYDSAAQTVWQAALMLLVPVLALWLIWKYAAVDHLCARWWMLPLLLCLLADAVFLITAQSGFIRQLVPNYPAWVTAILPSAVCLAAALSARPRGVRYGSAVLATPLIILLIFGTIFLRASTRADRLWPILGDGLLSTARSALGGSGAAWGAALLFAVPRAEKVKLKTVGWVLVPWVLCVICALWFGFLNPWSPGDHLPIAEKMMGLARHAHSVILYEISGVMWMLLIPASLTACFSTGGQLIARAFPRLPDWIGLLGLPAAALSVVLIWPDHVFSILSAALPWRAAISLLVGVILLMVKRRAR